MLIGKTIKLKRVEKELSQEELANKVGCTKSYISLIENNKTEMTSEMQELIFKILDIDVTRQNQVNNENSSSEDKNLDPDLVQLLHLAKKARDERDEKAAEILLKRAQLMLEIAKQK